MAESDSREIAALIAKECKKKAAQKGDFISLYI